MVVNGFYIRTLFLIILASIGAPFFHARAQQTWSVMTWNIRGISGWSEQSESAKAIGRHLAFLKPDIIAFNEIPDSAWNRFGDFIQQYLPDHETVVSSGSDGFIRNGVSSRFPIVASASRLDGVSLTSFGSPSRFTRDLFETKIALPDKPEPLTLFVTHLKAGSTAADLTRRAAEASAVSNYLAQVFLPGNRGSDYLLVGDFNEDIFDPPNNTGRPVQRLIGRGTEMFISQPINPISRSTDTWPTGNGGGGGGGSRLDYVLSSMSLQNDLLSVQVFQSESLPWTIWNGVTEKPEIELTAQDSRQASDHYPVIAVYKNRNWNSQALQSAPVRVVLQPEPTLKTSHAAHPGFYYRHETSDNLDEWRSVSGESQIAAETSIYWNFPMDLLENKRFYRSHIE